LVGEGVSHRVGDARCRGWLLPCPGCAHCGTHQHLAGVVVGEHEAASCQVVYGGGDALRCEPSCEARELLRGVVKHTGKVRSRVRHGHDVHELGVYAEAGEVAVVPDGKLQLRVLTLAQFLRPSHSSRPRIIASRMARTSAVSGSSVIAAIAFESDAAIQNGSRASSAAITYVPHSYLAVKPFSYCSSSWSIHVLLVVVADKARCGVVLAVVFGVVGAVQFVGPRVCFGECVEKPTHASAVTVTVGESRFSHVCLSAG